MRRTPPYANKHKSHGTQKQLIEGQTIQWPTEKGFYLNKYSDSEFLSYNLMLNSGEKKSRFCATKKINILTLRKFVFEGNKKP